MASRNSMHLKGLQDIILQDIYKTSFCSDISQPCGSQQKLAYQEIATPSGSALLYALVRGTFLAGEPHVGSPTCLCRQAAGCTRRGNVTRSAE